MKVKLAAKQDRVKKVAILAGEGLSQKEIASQLGISQGLVSELEKKAKEGERPYLQDRLRCLLPVAEIRRLRGEIFQEQEQVLEVLERDAGTGKVPVVHIIHSGSTETDPAKYDRRLKRFAPPAAEYLLEEVFSSRRTKRVAITWGTTLSLTAHSIRELCPSPPPRRKDAIEFMPGCGDPTMVAEATSNCSSSIVLDLHTALNGSQTIPISLGPVPASIPGRKTAGQFHWPKGYAGIMQEMLSTFAGYARVFCGPSPLIDQVNAILTTLGPADPQYRDTYLDDTALAAGGNIVETRERIVRETIGNIGGVFLPRPEHSESDFIKDINRRWTGVKLDHLERCARGWPGVIVLAIGAAKKDIVREAVRRQLVSFLLIDHDLAAAISDDA